MKIFLSYASEDRNEAEPIYYELINSGHTVFFDRKSLPPAEDFNSQIRKAVSRSNLMVFLISPNSVHSSSYTLTELKFSEEKWKHPKGYILPVMIHRTDYKIIPSYLKAISVLEPAGNAAAEVSAWVARFQRKRFKTRAIITILAAICFGSLGIIYYRSNNESLPRVNLANLIELLEQMWQSAPTTAAWHGVLATGDAKNIPFDRKRGGVVKVSLIRLQPDWTEWKGPKGAPGQDNLHMTICGSSGADCQSRQIGIGQSFTQNVADASGHVGIFNFATSPKMSVEISITYTK